MRISDWSSDVCSSDLSWKWDAYYQFGQTKGVQSNSNARLEQRFKDSIDAVKAPAGLPGIPEGTIICRATIADPTYGCVPSSIMGPGAITAAPGGRPDDRPVGKERVRTCNTRGRPH